MKVYFNASLAGKEKYSKEYKAIIKSIHDLGHTVYSDHVMLREASEVSKQTKEQHEKDYRKARQQIEKCDVMIVEGTHPSIGVGHTISIALQMYRSVLVLFKSPEQPPHGMLLGDPDRLLFVKKYSLDMPDKFNDTIGHFLYNAQRKLLKIRFNLMIDREQEEYLNMTSQVKGISKSDFVRQLIDKSARGEIKL